jgi:hypothetical protein
VVFESLLGTVSFTTAFVAGAMYLVQDNVRRYQRYNVILWYVWRQCVAISGFPREVSVPASVPRSEEPESHRGAAGQHSQGGYPVS